jgi:hypothetical protein
MTSLASVSLPEHCNNKNYHDEPSLNSFILAIFALTLLIMRQV